MMVCSQTTAVGRNKRPSGKVVLHTVLDEVGEGVEAVLNVLNGRQHFLTLIRGRPAMLTVGRSVKLCQVNKFDCF